MFWSIHSAVFCEKVFWNIWQNSQGNTCIWVFLKNLALQLHREREPCITDFLWVLWSLSELLKKAGNILKSQVFHKSLLTRNVCTSFVFFHIFLGMFSYPSSYLKRILFLLEEYFLFAVNCIGSKTLIVMSWTSLSSKIKSIIESFRKNRISYSFRKQPATSFFKNNNCRFSG